MPERSGFDLETLRRQLAALVPSDTTERGHKAAMRSLLDGPEDPLARDSFSPGHFTASAFVLSPDRDALLLIHHRKLQRWLQPGGHIEPHDTDVVAAARREVEEETEAIALELLDARDPLLDVDVHRIPAHGDEPAHLHHDLRVGFFATSERIRAGDGVSAARWVRLDEITEVESDASVMRAIGKLRGRLEA